jgi:hypothetical protein
MCEIMLGEAALLVSDNKIFTIACGTIIIFDDNSTAAGTSKQVLQNRIPTFATEMHQEEMIEV